MPDGWTILEAVFRHPPFQITIAWLRKPEQEPLLPDYVPGDDGDDEMDIEEDEDDDMDIDADEEDEDDEMGVEVDEEAEEEHPPSSSAYLIVVAVPATATLRGMSSWSDEVVRMLAISSPPASPLSPWSSSPPQIPFPLSPPSPVLTAPPPSPIRFIGLELATIRNKS
ncbi:hypothetical protein Tco_0250622 [Tanacetum coccineum]